MATRGFSGRTLGAALAAGAAVVSLACGAPARHEEAASPLSATAVTPSGESNAVSASANDKERVTLCHYDAVTGTYFDLVLPLSAVQGHLNHGDRPGSCTASCPCFTAEDIAAAASRCSTTVLASCPVTYSLGLFCAAASDTAPVGNLGYWESVVGQDSCSWTTWDPVSGNAVTETRPVDAIQFQACRSVLVTGPYYPALCPD